MGQAKTVPELRQVDRRHAQLLVAAREWQALPDVVLLPQRLGLVHCGETSRARRERGQAGHVTPVKHSLAHPSVAPGTWDVPGSGT